MRDFDALVFDMDGVIFDSERAAKQCWTELAGKYGMKGVEKPYIKCMGTNAARTREILLEAYGEGFPYDEFIGEVSRLYHSRYDGGRLPMKEGVLEILKFLRASGKKTALASSTGRQTVISQLRDAKILDFFDEVVTGDMVTKSKPEPDIFLLACEKTGVSPERAYAIEDSYNGIRAAYAGGLRPIMVPDLLSPDEEMREKSEAVIGSLTEVVKYIKG